jgi:hypothetical protein
MRLGRLVVALEGGLSLEGVVLAATPLEAVQLALGCRLGARLECAL